MTAESFLSSAVEAAVGMAGFAGIVVAIRHGRIGEWPEVERLLLQMLIVASASAVGFSLLPAVFAEAGWEKQTIWRAGSALLFSWQVALAVYRSRQMRGLAPGWGPLPGRFMTTWVGSLLLLQALNVWLATAWPYMLGVFGILGNAFVFFLVLLVGSEDRAAS